MNAFSSLNNQMPTGVKSAERVLDILEWLALMPEPASLQQVSRHFGFPKSSTLALLGTLVERGYVERDANDRYRLREPLRLRWATGTEGQLLVAAHVAMVSLHRATGETISLGVMTSNSQVRVLAKLTSPEEVRYDADSSQPRPAYCTAMGRVLLAHAGQGVIDDYLASGPFSALTPATVTAEPELRRLIDRARQDALAIVLEEFAVGGSGAAVPIHDASGAVVGALNVATVTPRFHVKSELILRELRGAANLIERRLGREPATQQLPTRPSPSPARKTV